MLKFRLGEILGEKGKSVYWLAKQTGMSQGAAWKLNAGQTTGIRFDTLDRICEALECQPGDLITHETKKKRSSKLPSS
ncbi:MAG TPA: helix-turn-helix transcriptional regulator [Blastocatellia bacterium]|nr:helix-turn-helix transcriptional regulator [Blastocatellia bacterium]